MIQTLNKVLVMLDIKSVTVRDNVAHHSREPLRVQSFYSSGIMINSMSTASSSVNTKNKHKKLLLVKPLA